MTKLAEWQPIESAPHDEIPILGWSPLLGIMHVEHIEWTDEAGTHGIWATCDGGYIRKPTHWMPLPKPPEL